MSFSAEFLAADPPRTVPSSGPLGRMTSRSTGAYYRPLWSTPWPDSPQAPDRNLALELVRVTEAAAMAASRWMGRGDKEGADGAAVNAMRVVLATVADGRDRGHRGGREGPGPDALQRRADRRRLAARRPTSRSTRSTGPRWRRSGAAAHSPSSPCPSAARCSIRGPASTWRRSPSGPGGPASIDITRSPTDNLHSLAKALGDRCAT